MSIFDQYTNLLPGDNKKRQLKFEYSEYQYFNSDEKDINDKIQRSYLPFYFIAIIVLGLLVAQLLNLQISQGSFNRILAEGNRVRQRQITAPRGIIYDSKNTSLVNNDASYCLEIYPLDLPRNEKDRFDFITKLSAATQISVIDIENMIKQKGINRADPIILKENIDRDTALLLEVKIVNLPGVVVKKRPVRNYQPIQGLSQIIGYVGKVTEAELKNNPSYQMNELIGKDGIEKTYQYYLKGKDGINEIEVDSRGQGQRLLSSISPEPGSSLTLALNGDLESFMANTLSDALKSTDSTAGSVVAINPKTGGVLGMVSMPSFDNNLFANGLTKDDFQKLMDDPSKPLFNRSVSGTYPSGSVIKPFVAAAALQEGNITENTTITDTGEISVGNYVYPDWKAHGLVNVRKAIAESCDVFFYSLGGGWDKIKGLGVAKLDEYLTKFGFGKTLGIDIPGEAKGIVPSPEWKEKVKNESWFLGDTYHMSIGQGDVLVTPLQMAVGIASVANGGELLKPYLVEKIKGQDGTVIKQTEKTVLNKDVVSGDNMQIVREGMRQAVTSGSASLFNDMTVDVAAKTGTAQFGDKDKTHAWMVAFAPYNDPQIALAVIIEGGGEGYAAAGPVAKSVLDWYFSNP